MPRRSILISLVVGTIAAMTLAGLVLGVLVAVRGGGEGFSLGERIAIIEVDGTIMDDEELLDQLRKFRDDRSVRGFVVAINSPGGVVAPSQSIYQELRKIREEDDRPVIASIGSVGASGGYYVALAADSIFALPGSLTGSIGVIMEFPNVTELMGKVGVDMQVVKSAEHKDIGSPFRPMSPSDQQLLGALVNDVYHQFVEVVTAERKLPAARVRELADGRVFSGRQAKAAGLIDRIGNMNDALAAAGRMAGLGDEPKVVRPPEDDFSLLDAILGRGTTSKLGGLARMANPNRGPLLKFAVPF